MIGRGEANREQIRRSKEYSVDYSRERIEQAGSIHELLHLLDQLITDIEIVFTANPDTVDTYCELAHCLVEVRMLVQELLKHESLPRNSVTAQFYASFFIQRCFTLEGKIKEMRNDLSMTR